MHEDDIPTDRPQPAPLCPSCGTLLCRQAHGLEYNAHLRLYEPLSWLWRACGPSWWVAPWIQTGMRDGPAES